MDAICCVMCADKKVTTRERKAIHKILEKIKAPWREDQIDGRINDFIQRVKENGLKSLIEQTSKKLPEFKRRGKENVLLRCIDYMARADGYIDKNELKLCQRFGAAVKKEGMPQAKPSTDQVPEAYAKALKLIAQIDKYIDQDLSGIGYEQEINTLVGLSLGSIRAIAEIWSKGLHASEHTDEILVEVLGQIARERSPKERQLAIGVLQNALDLPDDNTTRPMRRRNACISELDKLNALPGVKSVKEKPAKKTETFKLDPIDPSEIGPIRSNPPEDKPNLESSALCQLTLYPNERYEEVVQRFERNYDRWRKTFDARSLSVALCAYGIALEHFGRYSKAVLAHRWACKIYPYRGFTSCDVLAQVEAKAARASKVESEGREKNDGADSRP